jgi:hypothetical protein
MNALSQQRTPSNTTWFRHEPQIMEPTITQNGNLFAVQHRPGKRNHRPSYEARIANAAKPTSTLRTSVGEFAFRHTALGCHLELILGNARWALGLYGTNEAAVRALKNGRTGFRTWDVLKRKTALLKSVS